MGEVTEEEECGLTPEIRHALATCVYVMAGTQGNILPISGFIGGPIYGFMNWMLNTGNKLIPSALKSSY